MLIVYSITLFINAALLFTIEPMVAKMILPFLGGSPAVWNTSLVFYQACLLAGYAYAHFGSSWLGIRRHALLHLSLVMAALLLLPIVLPVDWFMSPSNNPISLVLAALSVSIGFPFLVLSSGAPLLQRWFAQSDHAAGRDPYFLYAASNAGSIAGLLVYPLIMEPRLTLRQQNDLWFYGYLILLFLVAFCVLYFVRPFARSNTAAIAESVDERHATLDCAAEISFGRRVRWIWLSFVPSSLLLGVTSYITTDIISAPLLWVVPLVAYLLSFIIAFGRPAWTANSFLIRGQAFVLLGAAITIWLYATKPEGVILPLHLIAFFTTSLVCHGQLANDRPNATRLTDYYFWVALGGALGGGFNALVAPFLFKGVIEYPLVIVAAAFARPYIAGEPGSQLSRHLDWLLPVVMVSLVLLITRALKHTQILPPGNDRLLIAGVAATICFIFAYRPVRFGLGMSAIMLAMLWYPSPLGQSLYVDRSFFGSYRATLDTPGKKHLLFHGTTIHGAQSVNPQMRLQPLTYYYRTGPAGQILDYLSRARVDGNVAVVGLGTGALACHGTSSQKFTFLEIDPVVEKIARNARLFTYLRDCPPKIEVVIGDARISLSRLPNHEFDLFVLDAFSSDVIPVHLLTREALELYLSKTAYDGILLFHISNRYLDLAPVLDRLANSLRTVGLIQNDFDITREESSEGKSASRWVMMARSERVLGQFLPDKRWRRLEGRLGGELWTDEFSDVLRVISWK